MQLTPDIADPMTSRVCSCVTHIVGCRHTLLHVGLILSIYYYILFITTTFPRLALQGTERPRQRGSHSVKRVIQRDEHGGSLASKALQGRSWAAHNVIVPCLWLWPAYNGPSHLTGVQASSSSRSEMAPGRLGARVVSRGCLMDRESCL